MSGKQWDYKPSWGKEFVAKVEAEGGYDMGESKPEVALAIAIVGSAGCLIGILIGVVTGIYWGWC
jgi:hypothetical protein